MNFDKSESQNELAGLVREILTSRAAGEGGDGFDPALWHELGKAGVLSAALPESLGGAGLGLLEQCSALIELGRAVAPVPYLASIVLGAGAIAEFGTTEQQRRWAEPAGRGELVLTAALEPAPQPGSGYTLAAGGLADAVLVPTGGDVFIAERSDAGVTIEPQEHTDGVSGARVVLHEDGLHELGLDELGLGEDRKLPGGTAVARWLLRHGTVGLCALQLGVTERALELTAEYARNRVQFARPIGSFQAVTQRLADAWIDVEAIRLTMWQAAWRLSEGLPADLEIATAKFWAADAGHRVAHTAVHIHGGVGIDSSYVLHRYFAAAKRNEFALGGATAQLLQLGEGLAKALHRTKIIY